MKSAIVVTRTRTFRSEVLPEISTTNSELGRVIAWADQRPVVWKVVTKRKSKTFGLGSCEYIGWAQQSLSPDAILERARHLMETLGQPGRWGNAHSIFMWRPAFTLENYEKKGFTGGFFQQHDEKYPRSCMTLDYTPETLPQVLDKFCLWMDGYYETRRVTLNGQTIRIYQDGRVCGGE